MFEDEEWRVIEEFPLYMVSSSGQIKHVDRDHLRSTTPNERGFPIIVLQRQGSPARYLRQVNSVVADAFLPPKPEYNDRGYRVTAALWHIDGDLMNCCADNLRWEERPKVIEWNEMHRTGQSKYAETNALVKNNRTGIIYPNTFECAMREGVLESDIIWAIEKQARHLQDDNAPYRYVLSGDYSE